MGCQKLDTDFCNFLKVIHAEKRHYAEKKCVNYYPFGLKHKGYNSNVTSTNPALKRKYNGIELEDALGLDLYEMDMRQYDPAIARWNAIDPVIHYEYSTYSAFDNNPIFWADPSGANSESDLDKWVAQITSEWNAIDNGASIRDVWGSGNMDSGNTESESNCCKWPNPFAELESTWKYLSNEINSTMGDTKESLSNFFSFSYKENGLFKLWGSMSSNRIGAGASNRNDDSVSVDSNDIPPMGNLGNFMSNMFTLTEYTFGYYFEKIFNNNESSKGYSKNENSYNYIIEYKGIYESGKNFNRIDTIPYRSLEHRFRNIGIHINTYRHSNFIKIQSLELIDSIK